MTPKRVLIVSYYWPPSGGGGVQRWLKFAKLLPEHGWEPVVVTPDNPDVPVEDQSLLHDVGGCLLYTSPSPRDRTRSRMPSSA